MNLAQRSGNRGAALMAIGALAAFAIVDVVDANLAMGHYESIVVTVSHDSGDVPGWILWEMLEHAVGITDAPEVRARVWTLALLLAVAATAVWVLGARRSVRPGWGLSASLAVTVALRLAVVWHDTVAAPARPSADEVLATRDGAYLLWTVASVAVVVTVLLAIRLIKRTTLDGRRDAAPAGR